MPDRRRHGQDEDRGARRAQRQTRAFTARPAGRFPAALCAAVRAPRPARQLAQQEPTIAGAVGKRRRHQRQRALPEWRRDVFKPDMRRVRPGRWPRSRAVRRHLQSRLRARKSRRRIARAGRRRIPRSHSKARRRRPAAMLRAHVSLGGPGRSCPQPSSTGWSRPTRRSPRAGFRSSAWSRAVC